MQLLLPDADGVMAPLEAPLYVNDADWLPADGARLVHGRIAIATAEALGAQSLRVRHQVRAVHHFGLRTFVSGVVQLSSGPSADLCSEQLGATV